MKQLLIFLALTFTFSSQICSKTITELQYKQQNKLTKSSASQALSYFINVMNVYIDYNQNPSLESHNKMAIKIAPSLNKLDNIISNHSDKSFRILASSAYIAAVDLKTKSAAKKEKETISCFTALSTCLTQMMPHIVNLVNEYKLPTTELEKLVKRMSSTRKNI